MTKISVLLVMDSVLIVGSCHFGSASCIGVDCLLF